MASTQSDASVDNEWVLLYSALFLNGYCAIAVIALTVYDWVVTLSREVQLFWTGRARPISTMLYFANKYSNLFTIAIATPLWQAPFSDQSCNSVVIMGRAVTYLSLIPPAMFAGLRTYALTQCYWLAALVLLLANTQFVTNMMVFRFDVHGEHFPLMGCVEYDTLPPALGRILLIVTRISAITADVLLIAITVWKFRHEGLMKAKSPMKPINTRGLASIMLYNGILYFIVLVCLNTLHLVLTEVSKGVEGPTSLVSNFTIPLSSILVSHFLLDLQEASQRTAVGLATNDQLYTSQSISIRSVNFASALGSLGATIDPGREDAYDDDEGTDDDESVRTSQFESGRGVGLEDAFAITEVPLTGSDLGLAL